MENVSKQNLHVFFQQWLYTAGHPILQGKWKYQPGKKLLVVMIHQTQAFVFQFPLQLAIHGEKHTAFKTVNIRNRSTNITVPITFRPVSILIDPEINLLFDGNIEEEK